MKSALNIGFIEVHAGGAANPVHEETEWSLVLCMQEQMEAPGPGIKAINTIRQRLPELSGACTEHQPVALDELADVGHNGQREACILRLMA